MQLSQDDDVDPVPTGSPTDSAPQRPDDRLGSWKAIAAYVKRDVTTVQRWEKREGMPVRRHQHDKRGSVYAFRSELDAWLNQRGAPPEIETEADPRSRRWPITIAVAALLAAAAV